MNKHVEKQYNRNLISSEDFLEAKRYLEEAQSNLSSSGTILKALLIAAIVSYCRPFTKNLGNKDDGATTSISDKFVNGLEGKEKAFHRVLFDLRNTELAHSDFDKKSCKRVPEEEGMAIMAQNDFWYRDIDIDLFLKLARKMVRNCIKKNGELVSSLG